MEKEKKEIGMEKLIELLNEYENRDEDQQIEWRIGEGDKGENGKVRGIVNEVYMGWVSELVVCSAYYGFIKWLVENDKIDLGEKLFNLTKNDNRKSIICDLDNNDFSWEDTFLMLLSISDTPIEDLCGYLKDDATEKVDTLLKGIKKSCESLGI